MPAADVRLRTAAIYTLVLLIVFADWQTAAGVVVGILLGVQILLSSAGDSRREVIAVCLASSVGFILAAIFGRGPISPEAVWLPNRVFAITAIGVSSLIALILQERRIEAERARVDAESARDLSRLLHSLMAHDLRAPLALARDALGAVDAPLRAGMPVDLELIADVDARLRRSLRTIELVLDSARTDLAPEPDGPRHVPRMEIGRELREEIDSFAEEAHRRGKELVIDPADAVCASIDPAIVRQAVAILVDNAIRYAEPGPVRISAVVEGTDMVVRVRDSGPGLSRHRAARAPSAGSGLGLRLCTLLVQHAGGRLSVARDARDGTEFEIVLPDRRPPGPDG